MPKFCDFQRQILNRLYISLFWGIRRRSHPFASVRARGPANE